MRTSRYDVVIVGGGSAGCVLANRLSAEPDVSVLLLEAGRSDFRLDPFIHMPAALPYPIGNRLYDWKYSSEPEPFMNGRRVYHARGKVLGGSSSINGMIFQRGNPADYERWAADPGMQDWSYAHCLPYFKRMETLLLQDGTVGADRWRGGSGPLVLERGPATNPLFGALFEAVQQAGYPLTDDVNGYRQEGFAPFDRNLHRGRRLSAARAYVHPVRRRPNLTVHTLAHVTGLRVRQGGGAPRVTGVDYRRAGVGRSVEAGEVVLCGGAIGTPQLLQLSGIGPAPVLEPLGVEVVADLPGVGANLQDHLEVYLQHASRQPVSIGPWLKHRHKPRIAAEWLFLRRGVGASNHFEAGGFVRSNDRVTYPNLMFHFLPIAIRYDGSRPAADHGYQVHLGPMYSDCRGTLRITSRDPFRHPALRFNYLSTPGDRAEWVEMVRVARRILAQPAFAAFDAGEISPGPSVLTDAEILAWVAADAETALHPSGTARMGTDADSVLDPGSMRVHGVDGLRVVDASAMPYVTNGNIYAPVMMLAEKAADLIADRRPLPPLDAPWYRPGDPLYPPGDPRNTVAPGLGPAPAPALASAPAQRLRARARTSTGTGARSTRARPGGAAMTEHAVVVRDLWKVFGPRAHRIPGSPESALPRAELRSRTGCVAAVKAVDFEVERGEVFVVMGLSGSGKSTLVRCLTRLIEPTAGSVVIGGEDVAQMSDSRLRDLRRRHVAMVFQHFGLLPHRRVIDNVAFGLEVRGEGKAARQSRAQEILDLVGLTGNEHSFPDQLSGGMQQRVGLGRALAADPELILFDEPFSALDPLIRRDMQNEVIRLHRDVGKTMIFITHDLSEALKLGDRILIMRDGEVVQIGTPDQVVGAPADAYVADFVSEVPKSHVLTLAWVMRDPREGDDLEGPTLPVGTKVQEAARAVLASDRPVRVLDGDRVVGVVTDEEILRVIVAEEHDQPRMAVAR